MTKNKYELRSKDVQEVMKTPPHSLITWGNTLIIVMFLVAVFLANNFELPVKIFVPVKIEKITFSKNNRTIILDTKINTNIPNTLGANQKAVINFDNFIQTKLGRISTVIRSVDFSKRNITSVILLNSDGAILTDINKEVNLSVGLSGTMEIRTGAISLLHLFINQITRI